MRTVGVDNAWFSFKGVKNSEHKVRLLSMPVRPHPARKGTLKDIPGRDGKLFLDEKAYDRILVTVRCMAVDNENIDEVSDWLSGSGNLVFGDEPDRAYRAMVTKEYSRSNRNQRMRGQEFTVTFDCEPFRYEADPGASIAIAASPGKITNPGTQPSLPIIKVTCRGSGTLMIGDQTMIFEDAPGTLIVDCDAKIIYSGSGTTADPLVLATQCATGEWIEIQPGDQAVSFTGSIAEIAITPRWRWL